MAYARIAVPAQRRAIHVWGVGYGPDHRFGDVARAGKPALQGAYLWTNVAGVRYHRVSLATVSQRQVEVTS